MTDGRRNDQTQQDRADDGAQPAGRRDEAQRADESGGTPAEARPLDDGALVDGEAGDQLEQARSPGRGPDPSADDSVWRLGGALFIALSPIVLWYVLTDTRFHDPLETLRLRPGMNDWHASLALGPDGIAVRPHNDGGPLPAAPDCLADLLSRKPLEDRCDCDARAPERATSWEAQVGERTTLTGLDLTRKWIHCAVIEEAILHDPILERTTFTCADVRNMAVHSTRESVRARGLHFHNSRIVEIAFHGADLHRARFTCTTAARMSFVDSKLAGGTFRGLMATSLNAKDSDLGEIDLGYSVIEALESLPQHLSHARASRRAWLTMMSPASVVDESATGEHTLGFQWDGGVDEDNTGLIQLRSQLLTQGADRAARFLTYRIEAFRDFAASENVYAMEGEFGPAETAWRLAARTVVAYGANPGAALMAVLSLWVIGGWGLGVWIWGASSRLWSYPYVKVTPPGPGLTVSDDPENNESKPWHGKGMASLGMGAYASLVACTNLYFASADTVLKRARTTSYELVPQGGCRVVGAAISVTSASLLALWAYARFGSVTGW